MFSVDITGLVQDIEVILENILTIGNESKLVCTKSQLAPLLQKRSLTTNR